MAGVTITRNTTLPDSSQKSDFHNLVDTATATLTLTNIGQAITYAAGFRPKRTIILTAQGAVVPGTNGAEQVQTNSGTEGRPSYYTLNYDKSTDEHAYWNFTVPDSYDAGNVTVTIYWTTTDTNASRQVQFEVSFLGLIESEAIDSSMGTATEIDDAIPAAGFASGDLLVTSATTISNANFATAGDWIACKLDRDIDGPGGTDIDADVKVLCVKIEWAKSTDTD